MLYIPQTRSDTEALNTGADRKAIRRVAHGIYTDEFDRSLESIVGEHFLAILGASYPDWYVSHSTAATLQPTQGVVFISGHGKRTPLKLPGLTIKRLRALPHPETVTLRLRTLVAPRISAEGTPASVQVSSPLQTVFEVLARDARQPERGLPEEAVRTLIGNLPSADWERASAFAARNKLANAYERYVRVQESLARAGTTPLPRGESLDLFFYHWRVGRLEALVHGEFRFTYDPAWNIELSGLPRSRIPAYEGRELPPFLDNLLPEGWAEAQLRATHKISREDSYAILKTTQKYLSNLTLRPQDFDASTLVLDTIEDPLERLTTDSAAVLDVSETIGKDPDTTELWLELRRRGATRLSGIQPKLPVHLDMLSSGVRLGLGDLHHSTTHILKFASREYPQLVENEWAMMELARRVALPVPAVRRVQFQEGSLLQSPALLVERFDLPTSLDVDELLLVEDLASVLGIRREDKYDPSHEQVLTALVGMALSPADLKLHFDHVLYSWLIGNGDLHAKNISVARSIQPGRLGRPPVQTGTRYAPLYDLVATRLVIPGDGFALTLNGRQNNLRTEDFAVLARRFGWSRAEALDRAKDLGDRIRTNIADVAVASGLTKERQTKLIRMVEGNIDAMFHPKGKRRS
ncbi:MAG: type II toxin-antitoxin system HipA family toxin [Gemmatimonadetes bacterium]|nr:type II toxin-antitoxin system HipA family toxin [Gemmatimonadota bacterium]